MFIECFDGFFFGLIFVECILRILGILGLGEVCVFLLCFCFGDLFDFLLCVFVKVDLLLWFWVCEGWDDISCFFIFVWFFDMFLENC